MVVCSDSSSSHGGFHSDSSYPISIFFAYHNGTKVSMYYEDTFNPPPIHIFQCERLFGNMMLYGPTPFIIFSQLLSVDFNVLIFYSQYHNYQMQVKEYRPLKWWISSVVQGRWCCVLTAVKSVCAWIFYATFSTPLTWCCVNMTRCSLFVWTWLLISSWHSCKQTTKISEDFSGFFTSRYDSEVAHSLTCIW